MKIIAKKSLIKSGDICIITEECDAYVLDDRRKIIDQFLLDKGECVTFLSVSSTGTKSFKVNSKKIYFIVVMNVENRICHVHSQYVDSILNVEAK